MYSTIHLKSNAKSWRPLADAAYYDLPRPTTFASKTAARYGYICRIKAQLQDTWRSGGKAFFYTLTHAQHSLPHFYGIPVHDYRVINEFFNCSGFSKVLMRRHNCRIKYFLVSELGNGGESHQYKGVRGLLNNPHYHVIFFLTSLDDHLSVDITADQLKYCVQKYWSGLPDYGVDPKVDRIRDNKAALGAWIKQYGKYGLAWPGSLHNGEILNQPDSDFANKYVCKYVVKNHATYTQAIRLRSELNRLVYGRYDKEGVYIDGLLEKMMHNPWQAYAFMHRPKKWQCDVYRDYNDGSEVDKSGYTDQEACLSWCLYRLKSEWQRHCTEHYEKFIVRQLALFRSRFAPHIRASHGVGVSALLEVDDDDLTIDVRENGVVTKHRITGYLARKKLYDVVEAPGNQTRYVRNSWYKQWLKDHLAEKIDKCERRLRDLWYNTDINLLSKICEYNEVDVIPRVVSDFRDLAIYACVYRYRHFHRDDPYELYNYKKYYEQCIDAPLEDTGCSYAVYQRMGSFGQEGTDYIPTNFVWPHMEADMEVLDMISDYLFAQIDINRDKEWELKSHQMYNQQQLAYD
ncbi:hypothetical protein [Capybara microvirus Cap3_SP_394]|nr:hypothetical protein [Capybara microvirus Cap3_SP_394]